MAEPFVHRLRVRYAECDAQGVVFNAHYLAFVVAESHLRFLASARFDEELDIEITVAHLGTTSMTLANRILRAVDATPLVEVRMRYVWVQAANWAKTPIPDWARDALAPRLVAETAG